MRGIRFAAGFLASWAVLVWAAPTRAGDTVLLNGGTDAATHQLLDDGSDAETIPVWHRGFGFGGYRGFGFGGYRGFGFGGYRGFGYGGFYRPYYGLGMGYGMGLGYGLGRFGLGYGYGGYGLGLGYGLGRFGLGYGLGRFGLGYGYGGYYPGFGYGYGISYGGMYPGFGYGGFFGPCAGASAGVYTLALPAGAEPAPPQVPSDGTYPYDGGPKAPASEPETAPAPKRIQQRTVPLEGRSVSLPKSGGKWTYPAYGETARRGSHRDDRIVRSK